MPSLAERIRYDFREPDFLEVYRRRHDALARIREAGPEAVAEMKEYYREHIADFIEDWGVTSDPRNPEIGRPAAVPFVLFPKQREFIDWIFKHWRDQKPGLVEKSRDVGISWLAVGVGCAMCSLYDGMEIGYGSRKQEYVDEKDNPKSLFWKARFFQRHIPVEFRGGWREAYDSPFMRMNFPGTGSFMGGEAGDDIGRGDRKAIFFVDEAARLPRPMLAEASLSATTNCRIDMSSVNGPNNVFAQKRHSGKVDVFIFDWRAQPLDAKLLTPNGWALMMDVKIGDKLIGANGKTVKVLGVFPQGKKDVHRITFSDGATTECCEDHLWDVIPLGNQRAERRHIRRVLPLKDMIPDYVETLPRGKLHRYQIPLAEPITGFARSTLPLDPYVLGYLLGDGSLPTNPSNAVYLSISEPDREIVDIVASRLPAGCSLKKGTLLNYWVSANRNYRKAGRRGCFNPVNGAINDLGLSGRQSHDKFIPLSYLFAAAILDRLDLLQGLMDADGCVGKSNPGTGIFTSVSKRLAQDVATLAQTLGGTAKIRMPKHDEIARFGNRTCLRRQQYTVDVKIPAPLVPFKVARKADNYSPAKRHPPRRSVTGIELVGAKECQCIKVDAADGLYLTDDCVVTHNSDPRKDDAWYQKQVDELDPIVVAQEIDRDYSASAEGVLIPMKWAMAAVDALEKLGIAPSGERALAFDVADEGHDRNAAVSGQGVEVDYAEEWSGKGEDIFGSVERIFDIADELKVGKVKYDSDGLGAGVRGDARVINERRKRLKETEVDFVGYRGSEGVLNPEKDDVVKGRLNEDFFANRKAQEWWKLRVRFQKTFRWVDSIARNAKDPKVEIVRCDPNDIVSINSKKIPHFLKLVAELSQPQYHKNDIGKMLVEKKPQGMKSPNMADAVVIKFAQVQRAAIKIDPALLRRSAMPGSRTRRY
jgi:hypothetical protein